MRTTKIITALLLAFSLAGATGCRAHAGAKAGSASVGAGAAIK